MKLTVVEVGGCPATSCELCDHRCERIYHGSWQRVKAEGKHDLAPCTVGYYLKPAEMNLGRSPLDVGS